MEGSRQRAGKKISRLLLLLFFLLFKLGAVILYNSTLITHNYLNGFNYLCYEKDIIV